MARNDKEHCGNKDIKSPRSGELINAVKDKATCKYGEKTNDCEDPAYPVLTDFNVVYHCGKETTEEKFPKTRPGVIVVEHLVFAVEIDCVHKAEDSPNAENNRHVGKD